MPFLLLSISNLKRILKLIAHHLSYDTLSSFYYLTFQFEGKVKVHCKSLASSFPYFSFIIFVSKWHIIVPHIPFSLKKINNLLAEAMKQL